MSAEGSVLGISVETRANTIGFTQIVQAAETTGSEMFSVFDAASGKLAEILVKEEEFATASRTIFAGMMEALGPQTFDKIDEGVLEIGTSFSKIVQPITEANSMLIELIKNTEGANEAANTALADWLQSGTEVEQAAENIETVFSRWSPKINEANSQLYQMLKLEEEAAKAANSGAADTLFARYQRGLSDSDFNSMFPGAQVVQQAPAIEAALGTIQERYAALGAEYQKVVQEMTQDGVKFNTALETVETAMKGGVAAADIMSESDADLAAKMAQSTVATDQLAEASLNKNKALKEQKVATDESNASHVNLFESMRGGRLIIAGLLADMALSNIAMGQQLPQATREAVKGIQTVIDTATGMAFAFEAFGLGTAGTGLALGALIGVTLALGTALTSIDPNLQDLNKQLDSIQSKAQVAQTLATIMGWTEEEAAAALKAAGSNQELADSLDRVSKASADQESAQKAADFWGKIGATRAQFYEQGKADAAQNVLDLNKQIAAEQALEINLEKTAAATGKVATEMENAAQQAVALSKTEDTQLADSMAKWTETFNKEAADELRVRTQASAEVTRIKQQEINQLIDMEDAYNKKVADEYTQQAINDRNEAEAEIKDAQTRNNTLADDHRDLIQKMTDQQWQFEHSVESINNQIVQDTQAEQDRINDIVFSATQSRESMDFNLAEAMRKATTQHAREEIMRRYDFERGQLDARTQHSEQNAQRTLDEQKKAEAQKEALLEQELAHQEAIDQREYKDKVDTATRAYNQELAALRQKNKDEHTDLENKIAADEVALNAEEQKIRDRAKYNTDMVRANETAQVLMIKAAAELNRQQITDTQTAQATADKEKMDNLTLYIKTLNTEILWLQKVDWSVTPKWPDFGMAAHNSSDSQRTVGGTAGGAVGKGYIGVLNINVYSADSTYILEELKRYLTQESFK